MAAAILRAPASGCRVPPRPLETLRRLNPRSRCQGRLGACRPRPRAFLCFRLRSRERRKHQDQHQRTAELPREGGKCRGARCLLDCIATDLSRRSRAAAADNPFSLDCSSTKSVAAGRDRSSRSLPEAKSSLQGKGYCPKAQAALGTGGNACRMAEKSRPTTTASSTARSDQTEQPLVCPNALRKRTGRFRLVPDNRLCAQAVRVVLQWRTLLRRDDFATCPTDLATF